MTLQTPTEEERTKEEREELIPHPEGYRSVLQNQNFLALWVGQIFSQLADRIVFVVFVATIVHHFGVSGRYTSFLYIAFTIPAILLTAIAGVFVDRWPRRGVLVTTNILRALFVGLLPWAAQASPWAIYSLAFLLSAATQFFVPAEAATIPMIMRKSQLITANSLFTTTMMASVIFGFALGDPLINIFTLSHVHWAIAGLFGLASLSLMLVRPPAACLLGNMDCQNGACEPKTLKGSIRNFMNEMQEGVAYIRSNKMILHAMLKLALLFSAVVALCILFVSFAKEYLYDNPEVAARKFAYIVTYSGIGMVLGAILVGKYFRAARRGFMVFSGFTGIGTCLLLLSFISTIAKTDHVFTLPAVSTPYFYLDEVHLTFRMLYTYFVVTVMGVGAAFVAIPLQALLHELIPEDKRGKILGVQFTILSTCSTLPVLIAGLGAEQFGVKPMFLMLAIPIFILGVYGLYRRFKHFDATAANW